MTADVFGLQHISNHVSDIVIGWSTSLPCALVCIRGLLLPARLSQSLGGYWSLRSAPAWPPTFSTEPLACHLRVGSAWEHWPWSQPALVSLGLTGPCHRKGASLITKYHPISAAETWSFRTCFVVLSGLCVWWAAHFINSPLCSSQHSATTLLGPHSLPAAPGGHLESLCLH